jgi:large subunit ribosomal protein L7/L12
MADETKIEVPAKFADLVKKIEEMSVLDLAELVKILEEKFGVSASAPMMMAAAPAAGGAAAEEEKTSFTVVLSAPGDKKIEVIKVIKDITQKGLKKPRIWWTPARPRLKWCAKTPRKKKPTSSRRSSKPRAPKWSSSRTSFAIHKQKRAETPFFVRAI